MHVGYMSFYVGLKDLQIFLQMVTGILEFIRHGCCVDTFPQNTEGLAR